MIRFLLLSIVLAWLLLFGGKEPATDGKDANVNHSTEVTSSNTVNRTATPLPTMETVPSEDVPTSTPETVPTPEPKPAPTDAPVLDAHEGERDTDF